MEGAGSGPTASKEEGRRVSAAEGRGAGGGQTLSEAASGARPPLLTQKSMSPPSPACRPPRRALTVTGPFSPGASLKGQDFDSQGRQRG